MTDSNDKPEQQAAADEAEGPVGGERLAEARREQQITVLEIAKELHLDEYKVRALERNEFDTLGAPVFAKGHLRKYAQLVNIDEGDVLADYYKLTRAADVPPVVSLRKRPRQEMSPAPWIAVIVVIVIVVTAYWWFTSRPFEFEPRTPANEDTPALIEDSDDSTGTPPAAADTAADTADETADEEAVVEETVADRPVPDEAEDATLVLQPPASADDGQMRVVIRYSGDCWTEISDATGRRLFFGLGNDGRTVELVGAPPFNALFGNADNVGLEVDGSNYTIPSSARRGRTARLTISSQ